MPLLPAAASWFMTSRTSSTYRNPHGVRTLTRVKSVLSTVGVEGAEHIVIAGGGDVGEDERVVDPHVAVLDREPAAHAPAVEAAAAAPQGLVVADRRVGDARRGVLRIHSAARAIAPDD